MVINKDKIGLADQSLPNAKCMLFGEVLNLITSKRANLYKEARHMWRQLVPLNRYKPHSDDYKKYKSIGFPFRAKRIADWQVEGNNLCSRNSQR